MPGFDGTGPRGLGPRTGGGFGYCPPGSGPAPTGYVAGGVYGVGRGGLPWGGGRGRTFGGGRGWMWRTAFPYRVDPYWGHPAYAGAAPLDEKTFLENQVTYLEQHLEAVKNRLAEIAKDSPEE